jgi:hypothetical protein
MKIVRVLPVVKVIAIPGRSGLRTCLYPARHKVGKCVVLRRAVGRLILSTTGALVLRSAALAVFGGRVLLVLGGVVLFVLRGLVFVLKFVHEYHLTAPSMPREREKYPASKKFASYSTQNVSIVLYCVEKKVVRW